jgi:hypothetical protein
MGVVAVNTGTHEAEEPGIERLRRRAPVLERRVPGVGARRKIGGRRAITYAAFERCVGERRIDQVRQDRVADIRTAFVPAQIDDEVRCRVLGELRKRSGEEGLPVPGGVVRRPGRVGTEADRSF